MFPPIEANLLGWLTAIAAVSLLPHALLMASTVHPGTVTLRRVLAAVVFGFPLTLVAGMLFGAPCSWNAAQWAMMQAIVTVLPFALYTRVASAEDALRFIAEKDNVVNESAALVLPGCFSLLGSWMGSVLIPLDWNVPYQIFPICNTYGSALGLVAGWMYVLVKRLLVFATSAQIVRGSCC
jgi:hypothetical protein